MSSGALQKHPDGPLTAATALSGEECAATNRQRKLEWPLCFVEALCDYEARKPGELSFKGGDLIGVVQKRPSGWWKGTLDGTLVGRFPLNHTRRLSTRHSLPKRPPPSSSTIPLLPQLPLPLPSFPSPNPAISPRPSALLVSSPFFASAASSSSSSSNSPSAVLPTSARSLHAPEPRLRGQGSSALRAGVSWGADESVQLIHEQLASALSQLSAGALRPAECQTSFRELPLAGKEELLTALEASDGSVEHWRLLLGTLLSSLLSP
ncbi:MAG: SH3 domain-containing protein, partial [archaeon]|nr:SH3 domain-containing protein [archaeon]